MDGILNVSSEEKTCGMKRKITTQSRDTRPKIIVKRRVTQLIVTFNNNINLY